MRQVIRLWFLLAAMSVLLYAVLALLGIGKAEAQSWTTQGILVTDNGSPLGYAKAIDCGANMVCESDGFTMSVSSTNDAAAGLPADPNACASGQYVIDQNIAGILACAQVQWSQLAGVPLTFPPAAHTHALSELTNPTGPKTFNMNNDPIRFLYTAPTASPPNYEGAFNIEASGGFTGDLLHVHQFTGNPGPGTHLISAVATDPDVHALHAQHDDPNGVAVHAMGKVQIDGKLDADEIIAPLASNAAFGAVKIGTGLSVNAGVVSKIPDVCTIPFATAAVAGLVRGTGTSLTCPGTTKAIGFDASGTLQCGTDIDTAAYTLPIASAGTLGGIKVGTNLSIDGAGVLSASAAPYSLPDATAAVTGGIRLTGDLGGTATSPSVVDNSHAHSASTISGLDVGDITTGTFSQARGGTGAGALTCTGSQKLTSNGTAYSCATDIDTVYTHPTGDGNLHVTATGTTNSGKHLTAGASAGSLSWAFPDWAALTNKPTTFTPPIATAGALGGVKIGTGINVTGDGTISKVPDVCSIPFATASVGGLVRGTGTSLTCPGTSKAIGYDALGTLQCSADLGYVAGNSPTFGDVTATRGDDTGAIYFGEGQDTYIYKSTTTMLFQGVDNYQFVGNQIAANNGTFDAGISAATANITTSGTVAGSTILTRANTNSYKTLTGYEQVAVPGGTLINRVGTGFWETPASDTGMGWPTNDGWYHLITSTHTNTDNNYSLQIASPFFGENRLFFRETGDNGGKAWNEIYHTGKGFHFIKLTGWGEIRDSTDGVRQTFGDNGINYYKSYSDLGVAGYAWLNSADTQIATLYNSGALTLDGEAIRLDTSMINTNYAGIWFRKGSPAVENYSILGASIGDTMINAVGGRSIYFRTQNIDVAKITDDGLTLEPGKKLMGVPMDLMTFYKGRPLGSALMYRIRVASPFRLPASLTGSQFAIDVNPTATTVITLKKNNVDIGSLSIATNGVYTVTFSSSIDFAAGDTFSVHAPGSQDATAADFAMTFLGSRL